MRLSSGENRISAARDAQRAVPTRLGDRQIQPNLHDMATILLVMAVLLDEHVAQWRLLGVLE
jgi:hypothetical protein